MKQAILSNRKAEYIGTNMVGAILMVGKWERYLVFFFSEKERKIINWFWKGRWAFQEIKKKENKMSNRIK